MNLVAFEIGAQSRWWKKCGGGDINSFLRFRLGRSLSPQGIVHLGGVSHIWEAKFIVISSSLGSIPHPSPIKNELPANPIL